MMRGTLCSIALLMLVNIATAQPHLGWHDDLAEQMAGTWKIEGTVMGHAAHHIITAQWALDHHFLQLHEQTAPDAPSESRYEAIWFLGYDEVSERYVLHLMDVFGGRFSETPGYGTREGNDLRFVFEYPDGPFHTRWQWLPDSKNWEWHLEQKNKAGKWETFADFKLTRM